MKKRLYPILIITFILQACGDKDNKDTPSLPEVNNNSITINIQNKVGDSDLILNKSVYTNVLEQNFTVNKFNYFISNILLQRDDNSFYALPQDSCYFLIRASQVNSQTITLRNLPKGNYKSIRFSIGVDSARSTMPAEFRTGSLDIAGEAADMYWVWNSGYIFVKLQCMPIIPRGTDSSTVIPYVYHIGGFGGINNPTLNNIREVNLDFAGNLQLAENNSNPKIFLQADALKVLEGSTNIDFSLNPTVMLTTFSKKVADNYQNMFQFIRIEN